MAEAVLIGATLAPTGSGLNPIQRVKNPAIVLSTR